MRRPAENSGRRAGARTLRLLAGCDGLRSGMVVATDECVRSFRMRFLDISQTVGGGVVWLRLQGALRTTESARLRAWKRRLRRRRRTLLVIDLTGLEMVDSLGAQCLAEVAACGRVHVLSAPEWIPGYLILEEALRGRTSPEALSPQEREHIRRMAVRRGDSRR